MGRLLCLLLAVFSVSCADVPDTCPEIRTWGRRQVSSPAGLRPASRLIVRDRQGYYCSSVTNCLTTIQDLQIEDIKVNIFHDIDCNVVIGGDGYMYEGAGWDAATYSYPDSLVFCLLQNKNAAEFPNKYQQKAVTDLIQCARDTDKLSPSYSVKTPRDIDSSSTEPVTSLYNWVKTLKHYQPVSAVSGK